MAEELQEELEVLAEIYEGLKVTQESEGVPGDFEVQTGSVVLCDGRSFYHQPPNRTHCCSHIAVSYSAGLCVRSLAQAINSIP